jgi:hypothetical protein
LAVDGKYQLQNNRLNWTTTDDGVARSRTRTLRGGGSLFPPPSLLPFPPHAAAIRSGAPTLSSFILKKKAKTPQNATRNAQQALRKNCNTICAKQHALPCQGAAAGGASAESAGAGKTGRAQQSSATVG